MKSFLISVLFFLGLVLVYYTNILSLFASKNALLYSLLLVAVVMLIGLKVLGNPFDRGNKQ
jgi:hypothetical protein